MRAVALVVAATAAAAEPTRADAAAKVRDWILDKAPTAPQRRVAAAATTTTRPIAGACLEEVELGPRRYVLQRPKPCDATPPAVVVVVHGFKGTPQNFRHLAAAVIRRGFAAVLPYGLGNSWNARVCCGPSLARGVDDVGFLGDVVADAKRRTGSARAFGFGFSNGGYLVSEAHGLFDAVSPWGGHAPWRPPNATPTPVLMVHGGMDRVVNPNGCCEGARCCCGIDAASGPDCVAFFDVAKWWRELNGCAAWDRVDTKEVICERGVDCRANTTACLHRALPHQLKRAGAGPTTDDSLDFFLAQLGARGGLRPRGPAAGDWWRR